MDLRLEFRPTQLLVNYHILSWIFLCCFRSPFRSRHANPNKRSDRSHYDVWKGATWSSYVKTGARDGNQVILFLGRIKLLVASAFLIAVKNLMISAVRDLFCKWSKDVVP